MGKCDFPMPGYKGAKANLIFHYIFWKIDISVTLLDIDMKFCMVLLHTYYKGRLSQILYLGPSFHCISFRK